MLTYETLASFKGGVQAKPGDLTLVDAPNLPGKKAWRIHMNSQSTPLSNPEQRVHTLTDEFITPGMTLVFGTAVFVPTDRPDSESWDALDELHQGWHGSALSYGGPAPGLGYMSRGKLAVVTRGGPMKTQDQGGGTFIQHQWGDAGDLHGFVAPFLNGIPSVMPKGRWMTKVIVEHLSTGDDGWVYAEIDGKVAVPKTYVPTCYPFNMFAMPVNGYRQGAGGANNNDAVHYMWSVIGESEAELPAVRKYLADYIGQAVPTPTPVPPTPAPSPATTATSSITAGAKLVGPTDWVVTVSGPGDSVEFYADGKLLGSSPISGGKATFHLDPAVTKVIANGGYHVRNGGLVALASPSIPFTLVSAAVQDIATLSLTYRKGAALPYLIAGKKLDGTPVGGAYASRDAALLVHSKFLARMP